MGKNNVTSRTTKGAPRAEKKKQHKTFESRKKLTKDPGLPKFGKYAPDRIKNKEKPLAGKLAKRGDGNGLAAYIVNAAKNQQDYETKTELVTQQQENSSSNSKKDSSCKAFYKEFRRVVESSDVLLEIIDARDPQGCRCLEIEKSIKSEFGTRKSIVLVLNKMDLVPIEVGRSWMNYLVTVEKQTVVPFCCSGNKDIIHSSIRNALKTLRDVSRGSGGGTAKITVGVIGYPNVGKSSVINALKRATVVGVGNTPGFTKTATEIQLNSDMTILDCPGIIFSSSPDESVMALRNILKVEQIDDPVKPVEAIINKVGVNTLMDLYNVEWFATTEQFLTKLAIKTGRLGKRRVPLIEMVAKEVLKDWNDSKIPFYTECTKETVHNFESSNSEFFKVVGDEGDEQEMEEPQHTIVTTTTTTTTTTSPEDTEMGH